jgi:hypothetical protein
MDPINQSVPSMPSLFTETTYPSTHPSRGRHAICRSPRRSALVCRSLGLSDEPRPRRYRRRSTWLLLTTDHPGRAAWGRQISICQRLSKASCYALSANRRRIRQCRIPPGST